MISYAQNFEDVMLWRALRHIENGFYVDIGAQDPVVDSVSMGLYEKGWRGVHVEPAPPYAQALRDARPDETVVQVAIGTDAALIPFYEIPGTGISTGDAEIAHQHEAAGFAHKRIDVPCITLKALFDSLPQRDIHWMKIDVEGMEGQVLRSWAPSPVRPWVVIVESTKPRTAEPSYEDWEPVILGLGYQCAYFDGLNRFYVSDAQKELLASFVIPPNIFDDFSLSGSASNGLCAKLNQDIEQSRKRVAELTAAVADHAVQLEIARADAAFRERYLELEKTLEAQRKAADIRLDEALEHARQITSSLQRMTSARDQAVEALNELRAHDTMRSGDLTLRRQEMARLEQVVAQRDALIDDLQNEVTAIRSSASQLKDEFTKQREANEAGFGLRSVLARTPLKTLLGRNRTVDLTAISVETIMSQPTKNRPQPAPEVSVASLLTLFDAAFVRGVYTALLDREVDPSGFETYVGKLRDGDTRESIIVEIATSQEARALARNIPGLEELVRSWEANRPNLARRLQQRFAGDSIESIARLLRAQENRNAALSADLDSRLGKLESSLRQVEAVFTESGEGWRALTQAHRSEMNESLRLLAKTRSTHRILQETLFHRLKAAVQRSPAGQ